METLHDASHSFVVPVRGKNVYQSYKIDPTLRKKDNIPKGSLKTKNNHKLKCLNIDMTQE